MCARNPWVPVLLLLLPLLLLLLVPLLMMMMLHVSCGLPMHSALHHMLPLLPQQH
jgi:hypothetical protein